MTDEIEKSKGSSSWRRNILFQKDQPDEFMKEYCYRVMIEGIISTLKKFWFHCFLKEKTSIKMWRCCADLYCGIVCTETGGEMNLRATLSSSFNEFLQLKTKI